MMRDTIARALVQARLADLHHQAQGDALARSARRARRQHSAHRAGAGVAMSWRTGARGGAQAAQQIAELEEQS
jgi:hypothetical protein